jgi:hypothetical protein
MITYINATISGQKYTIDAINRNEYSNYDDYCQALYIAVRVWRLKYSGNFTVRASRRRCKNVLNVYSI